MHVLDLIYLGVASGLITLAFVAKTDVEKSRVKVKAKKRK